MGRDDGVRGYLEGKAEGRILSYGLGDWYDLGPERQGFAQLTPVPLTTTAVYYYVVLLQRMARKKNHR